MLAIRTMGRVSGNGSVILPPKIGVAGDPDPTPNGLYSGSLVRAWVTAGVTGNIQSSYGVASVTDTGTGLLTVTFMNPFTDTNYAVVGTAQVASDALNRSITVSEGVAKSTSDVRLSCASQTPAATDPTIWNVVVIGYQ